MGNNLMMTDVSIQPNVTPIEQDNSQTTLTVLNPQDGSKVGDVPAMNVEQTLAVIDRAAGSIDIARNLPVHRRMAALHQVASALQKQREDFAQLIAREGIKPFARRAKK